MPQEDSVDRCESEFTPTEGDLDGSVTPVEYLRIDILPKNRNEKPGSSRLTNDRVLTK